MRRYALYRVPVLVLDCGRKPENPEGTHADTGRTCKLHTEDPQGSNPGPFCFIYCGHIQTQYPAGKEPQRVRRWAAWSSKNVCWRKIKVSGQSNVMLRLDRFQYSHPSTWAHAVKMKQVISGSIIICPGVRDHSSHITWWSGCGILGRGGDFNEFHLAGQSAERLHIRCWRKRFSRMFLLFIFRQEAKGGAPLSPPMQLLWWIFWGKKFFYRVYSNVFCTFLDWAWRSFSFFGVCACSRWSMWVDDNAF